MFDSPKKEQMMSEKILAELMDAVIRFDGRRLVLKNFTNRRFFQRLSGNGFIPADRP